MAAAIGIDGLCCVSEGNEWDRLGPLPPAPRLYDRWSGTEALSPNALSAKLPAPKEVRGIAKAPGSLENSTLSVASDTAIGSWSIGSPRSLCVVARSRVETTATERRVEDFASTLDPDEFNCAVSSSARSGGVTLTLPQKAATTMRAAFVNLLRSGLDRALLSII
jgi:hypothetical protein